MTDTDRFPERLGAAASAAWWTVLIGYAVLLVQYGVYHWAAAARPAWFLGWWGPTFEWPDVLRWWMAATILLKLFLWMEATLALWLTLWARRLRTP